MLPDVVVVVLIKIDKFERCGREHRKKGTRGTLYGVRRGGRRRIYLPEVLKTFASSSCPLCKGGAGNLSTVSMLSAGGDGGQLKSEEIDLNSAWPKKARNHRLRLRVSSRLSWESCEISIYLTTRPLFIWLDWANVFMSFSYESSKQTSENTICLQLIDDWDSNLARLVTE